MLQQLVRTFFSFEWISDFLYILLVFLAHIANVLNVKIKNTTNNLKPSVGLY